MHIDRKGQRAPPLSASHKAQLKDTKLLQRDKKLPLLKLKIRHKCNKMYDKREAENFLKETQDGDKHIKCDRRLCIGEVEPFFCLCPQTRFLTICP